MTTRDRIRSMPTTLFMLMSMAIVACMNASGSGGSSYCVPPSWGPEMATRYPFQTYARDVMIWSILTDLDSRRKCAAVILQLRGGAQELARQMPPQANPREPALPEA